MLPQSLSTDPRMGRVGLKANLLYDRMWVNCDDQGRISGDPDEIKYAVCPNINEITQADIPQLLDELEKQGFIKLYAASKTKAVQMLDWWDVQRLQWAYPSQYPAPEGWPDRLRYHASPTQIVTENWPSKSTSLPSALPNSLAKEKRAAGKKSKSRGEPLPSPENENEEEGGKRKGRGRGRGNLPSALGSRSLPSPATSFQIYEQFVENYEKGWGLKTDGKSLAQMRDFSQELSTAGCPLSYVREAFKEAAAGNKLKLTYVRAILLDWLGVERNRSP